MRYELFQAFERREYIHKDDLPILTDYICGNLNLIIHLTGVIIMSNITTLISYKQFAFGNKGKVYRLFLVRERQFATINLLIFLKIKNIKIAFAQQSELTPFQFNKKIMADNDQKRTFELFLDYWNTIVHKQSFGSLETFFQTSKIFSSLRFYWIVNLKVTQKNLNT